MGCFLLFEVRQISKLGVNEKSVATRHHGPHILRLGSKYVFLSPDLPSKFSADFVNASTVGYRMNKDHLGPSYSTMYREPQMPQLGNSRT